MGALTNVATRLQNVETLQPIAAAKHEAEKETKGWDRLPLIPQRVILLASATNKTSIPTSQPPTLYRFLNARNAMDIQDDCTLTYSGNNLYLPTSLCQVLLYGHILDIPDPDAQTGILPLLTPPYSARPANAQQQE